MTRSSAFSLARQRVRETGKPWLVTQLKRHAQEGTFDAQSAYAMLSPTDTVVAWISVNGSERVYDGLEAPASEETR